MAVASERLYHVSEESGITTFEPRPSPSYFSKIQGDVVFAINERLLHNYLLPRDCPRVTYYCGPSTTQLDQELFFQGHADYVIAIETAWLKRVSRTTLYCYEFDASNFLCIDECAGYYVSYCTERPLTVQCIDSPLQTIAERGDVQLIILPSIRELATSVARSSLQYSFIRMRNIKN